MKIFYDVDTQNDFMNKKGALYVPDAELIKPNLGELTKYALKQKIPILGSVDKHFGTEEYKHREGELQRWGGPFPDHCMVGTWGQKKIPETEGIGNKSLKNWSDNTRYIEHLLLDTKTQEDVSRVQEYSGNISELVGMLLLKEYKADPFIFEKQSYDVFTNPAVDVALKAPLRIKRIEGAIVYGVATDYCVKAAVLGMQKRGIQCYVVEDAIKGVAPDTTKSALEEMTKAGARLTTTKQVLEGRV